MENQMDLTSAADEDNVVSQDSAVDLKEEEDDEVDKEEGSDEEEEEGDEDDSSGDEEDDEDGDDDEEDDDEEEDDEEEMAEADSQLDVSQESDSDGEDLPTCPICLDKLRSQDIGSPESCDHQFCMQCIIEWSKNINTCPVDRQPFNIILARHPGEDKVFKRLNVEAHQMSEEEEPEVEEEEDTTECEVCNQSDREDRLLLCDGCDLAYHCDCLTPSLATVPVEEWFCPTCAEVNSRMATQAAAAAEEEEDDFMRLPRRQIARTRVSERVRQRIQALRMRHRRPLESSDEDEMDVSEEITPSLSVSTSRASSSSRSTTRRKTTRRKTTRRKTSKRRKTSRKRKTPTKANSATGMKKKTTRRKGRKRKTRKRKKTTKRKTPAIPHRPGFSITSQAFSAPMSRTIKGRIAERLGLSKPPPGRTIPMQRRPGERPADPKRGDYGTAPLSILGDTNELIAFPDVEDNSPHVLPAARAASTVVLSHPPIALQRAVKKPIPASRITPSAPSSFDLLGSIFKDQSILHMDSSDIHINRDGTLKATKQVKVRSFEKPPSPIPRATRISDLVALESVRSRTEPSDTGESPNNVDSSNSGGSSDNGGGGGSGEDNSAPGGSSGDGNGDDSAKDSDHSGGGEGDEGAGEDSGGGSGGGSGDGSNGGSGDEEDDGRQGLPDNEEEGEKESSDEEQKPQEEDEMESKPDADRQENHEEEQAQTEFEKADSPAEETAEDVGGIQSAEEESQSEVLTEMNIETHGSGDSSTGPKASTESEKEEGEISMSPAVTPASNATGLQETNAVLSNITQNVDNQDNSSSNAPAAAEPAAGGTRRRRERRKNRWSDIVKEDEGVEDGEVKMPQEVTTPFSLASFLSHVDPQEMQTGAEPGEEAPSSSQEGEEEREFTFVNGTFARVNKNRVDENDLDRRLDDMYEQRRVERGLLRMYGVSDHDDQLEEGEQAGSTDGDPTKDNDGKDKNRDADDRPRESRRRSGSRSRDRDRDRDRRRSRSRDRRRSRSRDRRRSRSKSRDRPNRRPRESGEDGASAGARSRDEKDRFGRDKERFGRDRRDQDRGGRDKDEKKDPTKERGRRSRSPRDRRIDNRDSRDVNRDRQSEKEEDDRFTKAGWRTGGGGRGGRDGGGWRDRGGRGGGRDRDGGRGGRFGGGRQSDWSEGKGEGGFGQNQGPKYGWNDQDGGRGGGGGGGGGGGRGWNKPDQMRGGGAGRGWNDPEKHGTGTGRGGQGWNNKPDQPTPGGMAVGGGASFMGGQDFFSHQQNQFQQPPPSLLHQDLPYGQQSFRGNQPPGLFNQPPPSLDPFAAAGPVPVPPPPQSGSQLPPPGGFQPWLGSAFQQQQALPTNQQTLSSAQQAPPPPPGMMGDYSQPPPPLPRELNLLNNGDFDTLKKSLLLLTGGSDPNTPVSGSPGLGGATQQGFGGMGSISDMSGNVPPPPALGERHSGFGGESGMSETSGGNGEGDPMDLDLPSGSKNDFQERVVEEVKAAIRPHFNSRHISKDEYKEILKKCVPKVCNSGEINSKKISNLVSAYVKKMRAARAK